MLYEKFIPVHTADCIRLSELYRRTESKGVEDWRLYLEAFRALMLKIPHVKLQHIPLFEWKGVNSSCWKFEEYRVMHNMHESLLQEAKEQHANEQLRQAIDLLSEAVQVSKELVEMEWYKTPYVRAMPEMRLTYRLSKLFATKGLYCYNMYKLAPSTPRKVMRMAYNLVEISNRLWKPTANKAFENKMLAEYFYCEAKCTDVFKERLSYSTASVQLVPMDHTTEFHHDTIHLNETVHYETVDPVSCQVSTIEQALQKCWRA